MTINKNPKQFPLCPDCDSQDVLHIGRIPATNIFAGQTLSQPLNGGHFWRCRNCHLAFRWPTLIKTELNALYAEGDERAWGNSPAGRQDWHLARKWLCEEFPEVTSLLDIGCFDGGFLDSVGDTCQRYGIEIHPAARRGAEAKGITMIGTDFELLPRISDLMDCVTAFDVIEHIQQPAQFLRHCCGLVKPGGWIIISTGNADAASFRFMGATYWYCTIAEHLSFISPRWCHKMADELGLVIKKQVLFSHGRHDILHYMPDLIKNTLYRVVPGFFAWLRQRGFGGKDAETHFELAAHPPSWMSSKDHFITLFQRR